MRWTLKSKPEKEKVQKLQSELHVDELIATLLVQRGVENYDQAKTFSRVESNPQQQSQSQSFPEEKKQNNPKDGARRLNDNDNIASRSQQHNPFNHENGKGSVKRQAHKSVLDGTCPSCPPSKFKLKDALHYFWRGQV